MTKQKVDVVVSSWSTCPDQHLNGSPNQRRTRCISLEQLSGVFLKHYSMFVEIETSDADLWSLQQEPTKTLRTFMIRFKTVMSKVNGINNFVAISALKIALWHESRLREEITVNRPSTIDDMLHRATNWAIAEEERAILVKMFRAVKGTANPLKSLQGNKHAKFPSKPTK